MHINSFAHLHWPSALKDKIFRKKLIVSTFLLVLVLILFYFILQYAENRAGIVIEKNWLTGIIAPTDFSNVIFACMYATTFLGIIFCLLKPSATLLLIRTYLLLQLLRAITLLIVPLDPPEGIIPLKDPFLHATFYNGRANLKDLFFSGHVATLTMFIPVLSNRWIKLVIGIAATAVGMLLIAQRVHYIVDVFAAPLFAIMAFYTAKRWPDCRMSE